MLQGLIVLVAALDVALIDPQLGLGGLDADNLERRSWSNYLTKAPGEWWEQQAGSPKPCVTGFAQSLGAEPDLSVRNT